MKCTSRSTSSRAREALWLLAFVIWAAPGARAACQLIEGDRITGAHLGQAQPEWRALPADLLVAWAPVPGVQRVLDPAQLNRLGRRYGLPPATQPVCFEYAMVAVDPAEIERAVRAAVTRTGHQAVSIEILDHSRFPLPRGEMEVSLAAASAAPAGASGSLLQGRVRYGGRRTHPFWARVRIEILQDRWIAARDLQPGEKLRAEDWRREPVRSVLGTGPAAPAGDPPAGMTPRRAIRQSEPYDKRQMVPRADVLRGESIRVAIRSNGARLSFQSQAETSGRHGERILLRNPLSGRRFAAVITGPGQACLDLDQSHTTETAR